MTGRRRANSTAVDLRPSEWQAGDYGFLTDIGQWWVSDPTGCLISIANHTVTEHDDGTITVAPSILRYANDRHSQAWHGYLERGVWRSC